MIGLMTGPATSLLVHYRLKRLNLLPGQQVRTIFVYTDLARDLPGDMAYVPGKHDDPAHACLPQPSNAVRSARFHLVGHAYSSCQDPVFGHVHHSAVGNAHIMGHILEVQKPVIAGHDTLARYRRAHAHPAYLIDGCDGGFVYHSALLPIVAV